MYPFQHPTDEQIKDYLATSKTIAVVGLSDRDDAVSKRVSKFMQDMGYRIIPVNPRLATGEILGEKVYASLSDIPLAVDIVNVFRKSDYLADVAREFVTTDARIFWAQLGLQSQEAAEILQAAGREDVVMDRCIKREYVRLMADVVN
ncbi:CoA-binding protein [Streptococcus azizii]|uniref:CoA-binding protein n=1 Tax=Streptococcus azizii TaxID=1579424 RepID=A0AB36JRB1_9STRE|nr:MULTISPECIES: CoA-binding protein [Streptococcus]MBF0775413.1 CoA-binding protein [Streptococcus sp. 19428wD3_AN2]ONK26778.1 CoA-binding protein [Streptococcus azizii]ONK27345.1 CoA-binding protein [Streptococcus azizii]ONK28289.1 CoA-binding protein [Streptococcus azizii]TFU84581.1 CoA-binding protein [Streptococcus sp. AN2]